MAYKIKKSKDKRVDKSGNIQVEVTPKGNYVVMYHDKNGMSALAKTKYESVAFIFAKKYKKDLNSGKLLREDKSAWSEL